MVGKVCIDSDVLINFLRKDRNAVEIMGSFQGDMYTTVINTFELWYGKKKQVGVKELIERINVLPLEKQSSLLAAEMMEKLKEKGEIIDLKDVIIAAICIHSSMPLLTLNKKHFERMQQFGLQLT